MGESGSVALTSDMGMIGTGDPSLGFDAEEGVLEGVNVSGVNTMR